MARNILIVGHSHIHALRLAAARRREADPLRPRTRTIYLLDPAFAPELVDGDFGPALKDAIRDQIERHDPIVASAIGGNAHAAFALIARDPFDFEIEGGDTLPLDDSAPIRTEAEVRARMGHWLELEMTRMRLLRAVAGPFWHIESPPPVRSTEWIMAHAEPYFTEQPAYHSFGVAPAGVRYRCWLLANRMIRELCDELGCGYVEVPRHLRGEAGLLRPSLARDATHAKEAFGEEMLRALEAAGAAI